VFTYFRLEEGRLSKESPGEEAQGSLPSDQLRMVSKRSWSEHRALAKHKDLRKGHCTQKD
jgi:hypothetical protein